MKTYRDTAIIMSIISVVSLIFAVICEFNQMGGQEHYGFYVNILLGLFSSATLTILISAVSYIHEKKLFYIKFYQESITVIISAQNLIEAMKKRAKDDSLAAIEETKKYVDYLIPMIEEYCYFIKRDKHAKLLETTVSEVGKMLLTVTKLIEYTKQLRIGAISNSKYEEIYSCFSNEIDKKYTADLNKCLGLIEKYNNDIIKNRKMKEFI
ncbi:hypothetical protein ACJDU8_11100 [Clostridium sp. WILCCON 0269]|uniref:Uncharacterized protein n=1 Tax=Candidatus Clostridium eludens TaxID=3381663 RepID=A0ABW8SJ95_9CLOT